MHGVERLIVSSFNNTVLWQTLGAWGRTEVDKYFPCAQGLHSLLDMKRNNYSPCDKYNRNFKIEGGGEGEWKLPRRGHVSWTWEETVSCRAAWEEPAGASNSEIRQTSSVSQVPKATGATYLFPEVFK